MQGMMGNYIENNIKSFTEVQAKLKEQAKALYGEAPGDSQDLWAQFLKFQGPAMQHMMGTYVEQSQKMFQQMQDTMQEQTRKIFPGIYVKPEETEKK
jgi:polyhydroxyalkanoate synthesis regulator protein